MDFYVAWAPAGMARNNITVDQLTPPPGSGQVQTMDRRGLRRYAGFKMPEFPIRLEFESGYDWHSVSNVQSGGAQFARRDMPTLPPSW